MKYLSVVALSLLAISGNAWGQQPSYPVSWAAKPAHLTIPAKYKDESAVVIREERRMELKLEDGKQVLYRTHHRIVRVMDDKGVESFNTIAFTPSEEASLVVLKARAVHPNGQVAGTDLSGFRKDKDENGEPRLLYAYEGVTKGSDVEFLSVERLSPRYYGTESFTYSIPTLQSQVTIIAPKALRFETKGYNGYPAAKDSLAGDYRIYTAYQEGIAGLEEEPYSNERGNAMRLAYRLSYVAGSNENVRQFSWQEMTKSLYDDMYNATDKERRAVQRYLEDIHIDAAKTPEEKLRRIEDDLKTRVAMSTTIDGEDALYIPTILQKKVTSEKGFARLFVTCLKEAGVRHELGLTSNRYKTPVDDAFEIYSVLTDYIVYLPSSNNFVSPNAINFRYPIVPQGMCSNKGIFCKTSTLGNITAVVPVVRTIPMLPMAATQHDTKAVIRFPSATMEPTLEVTNSLLGYSAAGFREVFMWGDKSKEKDVIKGIFALTDNNDDILEYDIKNAAFENYSTNTPLLLTATMRSPQLLEKAGAKYLLKIGEVIGRQAEMYNDEKRTLPIDMGFAHSLSRTIKVVVPAGYRVVNPEATRMTVLYKNPDGSRKMGFTSDYKMQGNELDVQILEDYSAPMLPAADYQDFRKVINAAADFNKITLVLEKV